IERLLKTVDLEKRHESVIHKCFSDLERARSGKMTEDPTIAFKGRTLYDLEELLGGRACLGDQGAQRLRDAYAALIASFQRADIREVILETETLFQNLMEYELTTMFSDWYRGDRGEREMPMHPPKDYDAITKAGVSWSKFRDLVVMEQAANRNQPI